MESNFKLSVKIGQGEFSAEGAEATVKEQFNLFLTAMAAVPAKHAADKHKPSAGEGDRQDDGKVPLAGDLSQALLEKVFIVADEVVSLRTLPQGTNRDADALVMLLFGFSVLKGQAHVSAVRLMQGADQSGLQLDRIDRVIAAHNQYVQKGGLKRGTRYNLNNPGMVFAKGLVRDMSN